MATTETVLAVGAHPDDIEFMMAGTLLQLKAAGAQVHMWNLARGDCGTVRHGRDEIIKLRGQEAHDSAAAAGAVLHEPLFDDLAIFYDAPSLARVAAVVRQIRPTIILTQSPNDYMEDHQNTCRLVVSAAFIRGMPNYTPEPPVSPTDQPLALYHALPHGLHDGLGHLVQPGIFVDIAGVLAAKRFMLAKHRSQKEWLDVSQGMDAYLNEMESMARHVGVMSGSFTVAEGWRKHLHLGLAGADYNPLEHMLDNLYKENRT